MQELKYHIRNRSDLAAALAGDESLNWHPLVEDFILVGIKLEKLGFVCHHGRVVVLDMDIR